MEYCFIINRFFRVEGEAYQVRGEVRLIKQSADTCLVCGKKSLYGALMTEIISARASGFDLPEERKEDFLKRINDFFSKHYWCEDCRHFHP